MTETLYKSLLPDQWLAFYGALPKDAVIDIWRVTQDAAGRHDFSDCRFMGDSAA